jgi:tetratricopeptide (TPR) repeat protein
LHNVKKEGTSMADIELGAYIAEIEEILAAERNAEAVAHCRHILDYYPKNLAVYRLLGKGLLELGRLGDAADILTRVLSAAPDDFVAHVGMAIIGEEEGDLDRAIAHMERALETQSSNAAIHGELKRLYGRRDGVEPAKVHLTGGALARLYIKGGNNPQAVDELRAALKEAPDRVDWQVLLARALWKDEQRIDAVEACQDVLEKLPYCLEVNSILYEIWQSAGRDDEAVVHWQRVEALDPYLAHQLRDPTGTSPPPKLQIPRLDYVPPTPDEVMGVPDWVRDLGLGEEEEPMLMGDEAFDLEGQPFETEMAVSSEFNGEGETVPDWLRDMASSDDQVAEAAFAWEEEGAEPGDEAAPDWLQDSVAVGEEDQAEEPVIVFDGEDKDVSPAVPSGDEEDQDLPEWLAEAVEWRDKQAETVPEGAEEDEAGDWLSEFAEQHAEPDQLAEPSAEVPDWLKAAQEEAAAADAEGPVDETLVAEAIPHEEEELPDWLAVIREGEEPAEPAGLEETPEPRPVSEGVEDIPDWLTVVQEEEGAVVEVPHPEAVEPSSVPETADELPDWLQSVRLDEEQLEEPPAPLAEEPAAVQAEGLSTPTTGIEEESVMVPSDDELGTPEDMEDLESLLSHPDDAMAWLEQLAAAQGAPLEELPSLQEGEEAEAVPADEIPDWLKETAFEPLAAAPELAESPTVLAEDIVESEVAEVAESEELPGWLRELEAPSPEPSAAPAPSMEEAAPAAALPGDIPDWLKGALGEDEAQELSAELEAMGAEIPEMPAEREEAMAWLEELAAQEGAPVEGLAAIEDALESPEPELPAWLTEPYEETPEVEPAPVSAEAEPAVDLDEMGEMPEDVDEAMAWLEQLAARQGAPLEELPTVSEAEIPPAAEAELPPHELETTLLSAEEPAPDWLRELEPEPAAVVEEPELPEWLHEPAEVEIEEPSVTEPAAAVEEAEPPEWLREPAEVEAEEPSVTEPAAAVEEPELPEWLREPTLDLAEEEVEELELPEWLREPAPEVVGEEVEEPSAAEPADLVEEPELPEWLREPAPELAEEEAEALPVAEPAALAEEEVPAPPPEELEAAPEPEVAVPPEPEPVTVVAEEALTGIPAFRQQLDAEPDDHVTRLALARALTDDGVLEEALAEYGELVASGQELDDAVADLERVVQSSPRNTLARRVLGDAYMKQNRLSKALEAYRQALDSL